MMSQMNKISVPLLMTSPPAWEVQTRPYACSDTSSRTRSGGVGAPVEEAADGGLVRLAVVAADVGAGHPDRIAEEVVLVQRLAAGEGRDAGVPDQPEQPDAFGAAQRGGLQVGLDVGRGGPGHVGLGR